MKNLIIRWALSALALSLVTMLDPGIKITTHGFHTVATAFLVVAVLAVANSVIRPLVLFFAWPVNCLTFGLFGFALNVSLFWLAGALVPGFRVEGALNALIGFIALGILTGIINFFLVDRSEAKPKKKR